MTHVSTSIFQGLLKNIVFRSVARAKKTRRGVKIRYLHLNFLFLKFLQWFEFNTSYGRLLSFKLVNHANLISVFVKSILERFCLILDKRFIFKFGWGTLCRTRNKSADVYLPTWTEIRSPKCTFHGLQKV